MDATRQHGKGEAEVGGDEEVILESKGYGPNIKTDILDRSQMQ